MLARHGLEPASLRRFSAGADVFSRQGDGSTVAGQYDRLGIRLKPASMDRLNGWAELMQGFHGTRAYVARLPVKKMPRALPAATTVRPAPKAVVAAAPVAAPVAQVTADLFKPATQAAPVKLAPKAAPIAVKPWPSTPPRGEAVKPVAKKAQAKVVAVKPAPAKVKAKATAKAKRK